jgi:hypothetical protein
LSFTSVELYVKRDGAPCAKCHAAEDKLRRLGVAYTRYYVEARLLEVHEGWREGSVERAAAWDMIARPIPFFYIDSVGYDYPTAMKLLKRSTAIAPGVSCEGRSQA